MMKRTWRQRFPSLLLSGRRARAFGRGVRPEFAVWARVWSADGVQVERRRPTGVGGPTAPGQSAAHAPGALLRSASPSAYPGIDQVRPGPALGSTRLKKTHHAAADVHLLELRDAAVARRDRDVLERHVERVLGCRFNSKSRPASGQVVTSGRHDAMGHGETFKTRPGGRRIQSAEESSP